MAGQALPQGPIPDLRSIEELLQAPTDGVGDAVVVPPILANQFELKIGLLNLLFLFSLEGAARTWLEKEPPNSITTWNDLVSKFVNRFFPPSKTTNLRNEIARFQQRFGETFAEAWDRFKDLLNKCPHHGFSPLHQIDTFYNSLNQSEQDSLNSAVGGNLLTKNTQEALTIIENKSKVQTSRNKPQASSASGGYTQEDVYATMGTYNQGGNSYQPQGNRNLLSYRSNNYLGHPDLIKEIIRIKTIKETIKEIIREIIKIIKTGTKIRTKIDITKSTKALQERPQGVLSSNTVPNPREDLKAITTRSGITLAGPSVPSPPSSSPKELPPAPFSSPVIPERNPHQPPIPYPSRLNKEKLKGKADIKIHSFLQMFKKIYFNISFAEALTHMPKFAKMVKYLLTNKEKLLEPANTPLNKNCSAVFLKKLPEKLKDTGRFLISCDFYGLESCMALSDLCASINLMPLSMWKKLSLPERTPTQMTLELATRTVAYPAGIVEDVFVQVGKFTFPADFVVFDYDVDPRVPIILGRPFLRMAHALVDIHEEELTLRFGDEKLVFNIESTSKYPRKHGDKSIHKIDILDITCEDHFHEVLNVQKSINLMSGSPTPSSGPVVASLSPSLTLFWDSDFILEVINTFLVSNDSTSPDIDDGTFDMEGDIRLIETLLNNDILNDLPPPLPMFVINETEKIKSFIDDPPDLELKYLPPHLEYAFLEGTSKLPIMIAKDLKKEEKEQLLKVLKSHKRAIV
ncbi:reverse transcriptase domain-containing protein [Tanacetum coccineum]